jgi:hypothetical protein
MVAYICAKIGTIKGERHQKSSFLSLFDISVILRAKAAPNSRRLLFFLSFFILCSIYPNKKWHRGHKKRGAERAPWVVGFGFSFRLFASCLLPPQGRDVTYYILSQISTKANRPERSTKKPGPLLTLVS